VLHKTAAIAFAIGFTAIASSAANFTTRGVTTSNDNSCDIAVTPAATLLLPYFAVDKVRTTLFTVINVSPQPQIARVTPWTDWAYPTADRARHALDRLGVSRLFVRSLSDRIRRAVDKPSRRFHRRDSIDAGGDHAR
jgi:hypothetical protein